MISPPIEHGELINGRQREMVNVTIVPWQACGAMKGRAVYGIVMLH
jgi:hypothetical protein